MSLARACAAGLTLATITACVTAPQSSLDAAPQQASAVVESIYAPYLNHNPDAGATLLTSAPWTNEFRSRIAELSALESRVMDQVGVWGELDFDPIIQSQENYLSHVRVGAPTIDEDSVATVEVRFGDVVMQYELVREDGAWRVRNLRRGDWNLAAAVQHDLDEGRAYEECRRTHPASQCALD